MQPKWHIGPAARDLCTNMAMRTNNMGMGVALVKCNDEILTFCRNKEVAYGSYGSRKEIFAFAVNPCKSAERCGAVDHE